MTQNNLIKLSMNNKRKEFLSRLLRISEFNDQINEANDRTFRQPVYTKRIKIMQVGQCQIHLPNNANLNPEKHNCQILVLSNSNRKYISHSASCNRRTIPYSQSIRDKQTVNTSPQTSPVISLSKQFKLCLDKKRSSLNMDNNLNQDINFVSSLRCQSKIQPTDLKEDNMGNQQTIKQTKLHQARNPINRMPQDQSIKQIDQISMPNIPVSVDQSETLLESVQLMQIKCQPAMISHSHPTDMRYFKSSTHINYLTQQKTVQQERKMKLSSMRQINKNYGKPFIPPPKLTAKSYIVCEIIDHNQPMKVVVAYNSKNSQEVASLTKIMTCIITVQFCQQNGVNTDAEEVKIGKYQSNIGGTSAELRQGQIYTVNQLLHGLMLPSGNDASLALAVWCGRQLLAKQRHEGQYYQNKLNHIEIDPSDKNKISRCLSTNSSLRGDKLTKSECYNRFIRQMNDKARMLKMIRTRYMNSHGLINVNNRSTAYDIALLSEYAMRNTTFREIVSCRNYEGTIKCVQIGNKALKIVGEQEAGNVIYNENQIEENIQEDAPNLVTLTSSKNSPPGSPSKVNNRPFSSTKSQLNCFNISPPVIQMNIRWQNTHKLLHTHPNEYIGIKTGFTINAGPCLSSCLQLEGRTFLIVVLGCAKMGLRFKETQVIKRWLSKHQGITKQVKKIATLQLSKRIHRQIQKSEDSQEWQEAKPQLEEQ